MDLQLLWWKIYVWTQAYVCFGLVSGSLTEFISQLTKAVKLWWNLSYRHHSNTNRKLSLRKMDDGETVTIAWPDVPDFKYYASHCFYQTDIALLAADENPKCFTRTQYDLTCFWEDSNKESYHFFYSSDDKEKECNLSRQVMDNSTTVHVCSFPPSDVYLYTLTHIRVVETSKNTTIYRRNISVEDQVLFYPPTNVSLDITEEVGQLQVTWSIPAELKDKVQYEIKYSSHSLVQKTDQVKTTKSLVHRLTSLVPGEVCSVQIRVLPDGYGMRGHWSDWSPPSMGMVPQSADDIGLLCHTSDLRNIQCQWNEPTPGENSNYSLFYKQYPRTSGRWQECIHKGTANQCMFPGEESSAICVNIACQGPHSRIFYSEPFWMNNSVKTDPPRKLRAHAEEGRQCLQWEHPLRNVSRFLMHEIRYCPQWESLWKLVTLPSSETSTCLDFQAGSQYTIQIRAKPDGSMYSGFWSDWSHSLTVSVPSNIAATLLLACIPFMVFFIPVLLIVVFSKHFRKIQQHLWPPVPNLERVLRDFITDINQNDQSQSFNLKQCYEDTITSLVEIVSEKEALLCGKIQRDAITNSFSKPESKEKERVEEHMETPEANQDYVTLNTESLAPCLWGNEYVYNEGKTLGMGEEILQMKRHCSCAMTSEPPSSADIFNQSYLLLSGQPKVPQLRKTTGVTNQYTNLDSTVQQSSAE